jgi:serine/threonine protein kinase
MEIIMLAFGDVIHLSKGNYTLRAPIGGSAYGLVWRASGPHAEQEVALKLVNQAQMRCAAPELQPRWIDSATKEVSFLRSLAPWDERHIVRLHDDGMHEGLPVIALELMATDLGRYMAEQKQSQKKLPFARVLDWMAQINRALSKVHQYGWRYLDLKPANLLLSQDLTTLKLADFGTSRVLHDLAAHSYAGTANWQAPEQFFPAASVNGDSATPANLGSQATPLYATDARSDYFALGALFYFLVTGGLPLRFCSLCGLAFRQCNEPGAEVFQNQCGDTPYITFYPDEKNLFVRMIDAQTDMQADHLAPGNFAPDGTWCPQDDGGGAPYAASPCAAAALLLLQTLLAYHPDQRPQNGLDISRKIDAISRMHTPQGEVGRAKTEHELGAARAKRAVRAASDAPTGLIQRNNMGSVAQRLMELRNAVCIMAACVLLLTILVWPATLAISFATNFAVNFYTNVVPNMTDGGHAARHNGPIKDKRLIARAPLGAFS